MFSFSSSLYLDVTQGSPLTQLAMAQAGNLSKPLENGGGAELDRKVGLRVVA